MKAAFVLLSMSLAACAPAPLRPCENPDGTNARGTYVRSPALECPSRLCLVAAHDTVDAGLNHRYCQSGFACAAVAVDGDITKRTVCACREDVAAP